MKNSMKLAVLATVLSLVAVQARADHTNLVRNMTIQLVGFKQGGSTTSHNVTTMSVDRVRIGTQEVIAAIGAVTGVSFSPEARLVVITPLPNGYPTFAIRDAGSSMDVSPFFSYEKLSEAVGKSTVNSRTGKYAGSSYSIQRFALQDVEVYGPLPLHYDLRGVAVDAFSNMAPPGPRNELEADVSGAGDSQGELLILQGTIRILGNTLEVVPGGGGDPT